MTQDDNTNPLAIEVARLQEELATMTETARRSMADFQNLKRRTEEERSELAIHANARLLNAIFPALDNLARAMDNVPEELQDHDFIKGVQAMEDSLMAALAGLGLESINEVGVACDPNQHEVLMQGEGPAGQVVQIFEKGYRFKGKTIRPAKVQVGSGE